MSPSPTDISSPAGFGFLRNKQVLFLYGKVYFFQFSIPTFHIETFFGSKHCFKYHIKSCFRVDVTVADVVVVVVLVVVIASSSCSES